MLKLKDPKYPLWRNYCRITVFAFVYLCKYVARFWCKGVLEVLRTFGWMVLKYPQIRHSYSTHFDARRKIN